MEKQEINKIEIEKFCFKCGRYYIAENKQDFKCKHCEKRVRECLI